VLEMRITKTISKGRVKDGTHTQVIYVMKSPKMEIDPTTRIK